MDILVDCWLTCVEVTVILFVELAVGIVAIVAGFGFKHTYLVSGYIFFNPDEL